MNDVKTSSNLKSHYLEACLKPYKYWAQGFLWTSLDFDDNKHIYGIKDILLSSTGSITKAIFFVVNEELLKVLLVKEFKKDIYSIV